MSITVKVYYRIGGLVEVRRFLVNITDGDFFARTEEKIKQLYTVLANSKVTLSWRDPDGDLVAFSTMEEMKEGLKHVTDGAFRVGVFEGAMTLERPEPQNQESPGRQQPAPHHPSNSQTSMRVTFNTTNQSQPQGPSPSQQHPRPGSGHTDELVHLGIWCDACKGPVKGTRYKCSVCHNFDLCQTCKAKGLHPEHDMLRINHPQNSSRFRSGQRLPVSSHDSCQQTSIHHRFNAPGAHADTFNTPNQNQPQGSVKKQHQQPRPVSGHTEEPDGDACQCPVKGTRCKWCVCPDFCQMCKVKEVQSQHDMCKINHPHDCCQVSRCNFASSTVPIRGTCRECQPGSPHPVSTRHPPKFSVPRAADASASTSSSSSTSSEGTNTDKKDDQKDDQKDDENGEPSVDRKIKIIINNTKINFHTHAETRSPAREQPAHQAPNGRQFRCPLEHVPQGLPDQHHAKWPCCGCQQRRQQSGCLATGECTRQCRRQCYRGCCQTTVQHGP